MTRPFAAILCLASACFLAGCNRQPPDPYVPQPVKAVPQVTLTPGSEASLMPLDKGNQWTYTVKLTRMIGGQQQPATTSEVTWRVASSQQGADGTKATVEVVRNGNVEDQTQWLVTSKGIYQTSSGKDPVAYQPMAPVIVFPVKEGTTFDWKGTGLTSLGGRGTSTSNSKILPNTEIDTDMGTMAAIPVETMSDIQANGKKGQSATTVWFVPGTGIARIREEALSGDRGFILLMSLKSKSLAKS